LTQIWKRPGILLRLGTGGRSRRVSPARNWMLSAILLAVGVTVGLSCLPNRPTLGPAAIDLVDPAAPGMSPATYAPATYAPAVFALRENGAAVRFAHADGSADGSVRIGFYDPLDPLLVFATEPVSLPADARLLWLLAAPAERAAIRERSAAFAGALASDSRAILTSPEFRDLYRDRFQAVFQAAARDAWTVTLNSEAWRDLTRGMEPALREMINREIRPVLERRFRGVAGQMLRANALAMIDPFTDRPWNTLPIEEALRASFLELRERGMAERAIAHLLDQPQAAAVPGVFQDEMVRRLVRDDTLVRLVSEMVFDERLRPLAQTSVARANDLLRTAPRLLVSLRGGQELNLVAATVIRATIGGRGDRVVVFMSQAQRDDLNALDHAVVRPLERIGGS